MKKSVLVLFAIVAIAGSALAQTQVPACTQTTLAAILATNFQCVDQDKLYSNFTYNPDGGVAPSAVQVTVDFGTLGPLELHNVAFQAGGVGWTSNVGIGYSITVLDPLRYISSVQVDATFQGTAGGTVTQTNTPAGSVNPLVVTATSGPALTAHNTQALAVSILGTPNAGSAIKQITSVYTQSPVSDIPEPGTMALLGGGLLLAGFFGRRARKA